MYEKGHTVVNFTNQIIFILFYQTNYLTSLYAIKMFYQLDTLTYNTKIMILFLLGSCWAFSATGAIEGASALATGKLISVSEQELLDCAYSFGCGGGWIDKALDWVIGNRGIASEIDYPYTARKGTCRASTVEYHFS